MVYKRMNPGHAQLRQLSQSRVKNGIDSKGL
jgi:hypothetical protein